MFILINSNAGERFDYKERAWIYKQKNTL